uniref:peptidyl-tRNA hydrolase n=1 Tax=Arcella intermedia TaxID=1963864 RepID=A0A6B2LTL0_9EUKA
MSTGKIAAQCAHAAIGIYKRISSSSPAVLQKWEKSGQKKVVVGIADDKEMNKLEMEAIQQNLPTHKVRDAGRTEVEPGTSTVLAVIGPSWQVDQVTGHLHLYK